MRLGADSSGITFEHVLTGFQPSALSSPSASWRRKLNCMFTTSSTIGCLDFGQGDLLPSQVVTVVRFLNSAQRLFCPNPLLGIPPR